MRKSRWIVPELRTWRDGSVPRSVLYYMKCLTLKMYEMYALDNINRCRYQHYNETNLAISSCI